MLRIIMGWIILHMESPNGHFHKKGFRKINNCHVDIAVYSPSNNGSSIRSLYSVFPKSSTSKQRNRMSKKLVFDLETPHTGYV